MVGRRRRCCTLPLLAVAAQVIYFSSVLFCRSTTAWHLFRAGSRFICVPRSDAALAAGDSGAELWPSGRASSSPGVLQKHEGELGLSAQLTFTDVTSGTARPGRTKGLIPLPGHTILLGAFLGRGAGAAAARSSQILVVGNGRIYCSSSTQGNLSFRLQI